MSNNIKWFNRFASTYQSGIAHAFILHFNVGDYTGPSATIPPVNYIEKKLADWELVVTFSRDQGIQFSTVSMKNLALDLLGLAEDNSPQEPTNPALAALQSAGLAAPIQSQDDFEFPRDIDEALPILDKLLRLREVKTCVIIENAQFIVPDNSLGTMSPEDRNALALLTRWGRDSELTSNPSGSLVFLTTNNISSIHSALREASNRYEAIEISLPDLDSRYEFLKLYIARHDIQLAKDVTIRSIANATAGLSLLHIEDILLRAGIMGELTDSQVWERKEDIIRSEFGEVLEIMDPRFSFDDIGDLEHVKKFFIRSVIKPIKEGRTSRVPQGILMTGPAGTGKSICAEAVAKEAGINAVNLRIGGNIASKWQGEGERNLAKALSAIRSLSPTIVFIDEIDQAMDRGNSGSGNQQDKRIFQRLLEFMSDTSMRGQVVFLAATNRPDLMDAALKRPGRFDKKIPFLVPEDNGRKSIFEVMINRYFQKDVEASHALVQNTSGWTGAEIESAVVKAVELVEDEELTIGEALQAATERLTPSTADIEFMTMLAIKETNDTDLLPPKYQKLGADRAKLDKKIEAVNPDKIERQQRVL